MGGLADIKRIFMNKLANIVLKAIATSQFTKSNESYQKTNALILADESKNNLTHLREYGFYSVPKSGAECLTIFPGGSKDEGFIIKACHQAYEPTTDNAEGNVMMLHWKGHKILLTESEGLKIEVKESKPVTIIAKNVDIELETGGQFSVGGTNLTVDA